MLASASSRRRSRWPWPASLIVAAFVAAPLAAAIEWQLDSSTFQPPSPAQTAFSLPAQSGGFKDSLDQFERMVQHEQWEAAFDTLTSISAKNSAGFIDRGDGVLVPARLLVRTLQARLPEAGRKAYRLFHDSQAVGLFQSAAGPKELENLSALVADHLISSVGDNAADRLGDLLFERGEYEQAATAWQAIVDQCSDSEIPQPLALLKIATAYARAGRWDHVERIKTLVDKQHANAKVTLAGQSVAVAARLEDLLRGATQQARPADEPALPADFALPSAREASWRFPFYNTIGERGLANPFQLNDVYGRPRSNDFYIPAAADETRVYVNLFGVQMAFDLATGKLVWSSGKLHEVNLQQAQQGVNPERYAIAVRDGRVWVVGRDVEQAQQQGAFRLVLREAASGKEIFSSHRTLSSWSILGQPLLVGDVAYVGAHRHGRGRELSLLILDARTGKLQKTIAIGNYMVDQNQVAIDTCSQPSMVCHADRLYVDTNAGALVSIDPAASQVEWAVQYESPPPTAGHHYNYLPPQHCASRPMFLGGVLFSKGMRSPRLLGLSVVGPKLLWNRAVAPGATLVGADERCIYLGGEELTAYDRQTQKLLWATQLPRSPSWSLPQLTQSRIYQFTSRGVCEIDKSSGEIIRIFRGDDLDSFGGHLFVAPHALVTVSNEGIVAYPLEAGEKLSRN